MTLAGKLCHSSVNAWASSCKFVGWFRRRCSKHVQWETDPGTWRANLSHGHFVVGEMSCSRDRCAVWHGRVEKWHPVHGVVKTGQQQVYDYQPCAITIANTAPDHDAPAAKTVTLGDATVCEAFATMSLHSLPLITMGQTEPRFI